MTFLRPNRSATMPVSGAVMATAMVDTVTTSPMAPADAWKAFANSGSKGCGANRVRNAQNPANTTAAVRVRAWGGAASRAPGHATGTGSAISSIIDAAGSEAPADALGPAPR